MSNPSLPIYLRHTRYNTNYLPTVDLPLAPLYDWGGEASWAVRLVESISERSARSRLPDADGRALRTALEVVVRAPFPAGARRTPPELTPEIVGQCFRHLESLLAEDDQMSDLSKYRTSVNFRKTFLRSLPYLGASPRITERSINFKTRLTAYSPPRQLISDMAGELPPIGATPHDNLPELKRKIVSRVDADLQMVRSAASSELESAARLRSYLRQCAEDVEDLNLVTRVHKATTQRSYDKAWYQPDLKKDISSYVGALVISNVANELNAHSSAGWPICYGGVVDEHLKEAVRWPVAKRRLIGLYSYASPQELHAACLIIQAATAWNVSAVLTLERSAVREHQGHVTIQSYKSKTDDDTPPHELPSETEAVDIDEEDDQVLRALRLLIWNHESTIRLGYKPASDQRLFVCATSYRENGLSDPQRLHKEFIGRYKLPTFSLEQVRTQAIFAESLGTAEGAKRKAGHKSMRVTTRYADQEVAKRLASAINLEFQRRVERELTSALRNPAARRDWKLLQPVGDGAYCADPRKPPWNPSAINFCPGERCHVDGGCGNRRIVVSSQSIKEALITKRMYDSSWQDLLTHNPHAFVEQHIPRIIFNRAFVRLCEEGPYAHVVADIKAKLV